MKTTLLLLLTLTGKITNASSFTCPPVLKPDQRHVLPTCPGVGAIPTATPNTRGAIWFEDLWNPGLSDFNDFVVGFNVDETGTQTTLTYLGSNASYVNTLWLEAGAETGLDVFLFGTSSGTFLPPVTITTTPNQPLNLYLTNPNGINFRPGPASLNPDGRYHAWVFQTHSRPDFPPAAVPEPATFLTAGLALLTLARARARMKRA